MIEVNATSEEIIKAAKEYAESKKGIETGNWIRDYLGFVTGAQFIINIIEDITNKNEHRT